MPAIRLIPKAKPLALKVRPAQGRQFIGSTSQRLPKGKAISLCPRPQERVQPLVSHAQRVLEHPHHLYDCWCGTTSGYGGAVAAVLLMLLVHELDV